MSTESTLSVPGEGPIKLNIHMVSVAAGLNDVDRHALYASVRDHAESCALAERIKIVRFIESSCKDERCGESDATGNCAACSLLPGIEAGVHRV